jgi:hypothetical protein
MATGMDDAGVGFARPERGIRLFFEKSDPQPIPRKFACDGPAHHTCSDDDDIVFHFHTIISDTMIVY